MRKTDYLTDVFGECLQEYQNIEYILKFYYCEHTFTKKKTKKVV